jgi:hypothetical protein
MPDVRDLRGTLADMSDTEMAGFLPLQEPTKAMHEAASLTCQYDYDGTKYDRLQFLNRQGHPRISGSFNTPTKMVSRVSSAQGSLAL